MSFEVISEEGFPDYEVWTCDVCGYSVHLVGVGGDVGECPRCVNREYDAVEDEDVQRDKQSEIALDIVIKQIDSER